MILNALKHGDGREDSHTNRRDHHGSERCQVPVGVPVAHAHVQRGGGVLEPFSGVQDHDAQRSGGLRDDRLRAVHRLRGRRRRDAAPPQSAGDGVRRVLRRGGHVRGGRIFVQEGQSGGTAGRPVGGSAQENQRDPRLPNLSMCFLLHQRWRSDVPVLSAHQ